MKFKATITISGQNYNKPTSTEIVSETFDEVVEFAHNPEQYGTGFSMLITSKREPYGAQGYDLRYDKRLDPKNLIGYLARFYSDKFNGQDGAWMLDAISISAAE